MAQEPERKKKCMEQRRDRLRRQKHQSMHHFDTTYVDQIQSQGDNVGASLQQGLQAKNSPATKQARAESSMNSMNEQIWYD
jgi:predicted outer membrane protein